jgi:hypothetical protein
MNTMKKSNIFLGKRNRLAVFLILVLFSFTFMSFPSCMMEDDIPPPSAYVPPVPDTTGACVFLTVVPVVNADSALDFECEGPEYTFFGEKDGSIMIEHADNPAPGGINTSEKVVKVTQAPGVEPWAGFFFDLSEKIDFTDNPGVIFKVYSPAAGQMITLKLEDKDNGTINSEVSLPTTVANEWEEMCFGYSTNDNGKFDRFTLFFDFQGPKDTETIHYFDDIVLSDKCMAGGGGPVDSPSVAAPVPTVPGADVISIFSNAYTDVAGTDFNPGWGQATKATIIEIAGDSTLRYGNLNYQGIGFGSSVDVSMMTHLHLDYWTADATALSCFIISPGPLETPSALTVTTREWVSVDIPLSEYASVVDLADVFQMKFVGNGTVYLDNIYFY